MLADLWGTVNTVVIPNDDDCIADVGDGSGGVEGGGGNNDLAVPPDSSTPPLVVLVVVVIFDATSLLPAGAPVDCGILPPLGGNTCLCEGDHRGGIPPTARGGTANGGGSCSLVLNGEPCDRRGTTTAADGGNCLSRPLSAALTMITSATMWRGGARNLRPFFPANPSAGTT